MPSLENISAMTVNTPPAPSVEADTEQTQPARELTQTDHLNKRLLKSLLESMKAATETTEPAETESSNSDFDD
ncbi:CG13751 [Drosophila busckii]|uniref:CG13751 n=1 Tax=Drosophila busckii TaxID=30019 RepID=A0A0M4ETP6_DROBS|nr:uncharacterized protein LOC108595481 [Drosophila busckii]ALC40645.1 CG13751 [Drosophila busckii]